MFIAAREKKRKDRFTFKGDTVKQLNGKDDNQKKMGISFQCHYRIQKLPQNFIPSKISFKHESELQKFPDE